MPFPSLWSRDDAIFLSQNRFLDYRRASFNLSGNPIKLRGQTLLKGLTGQTLFRSDLDSNINASISEIEPFQRVDSGLSGITTYYKISLFVGYDEGSDVAGDFVVVPTSKSMENVSAADQLRPLEFKNGVS